MAKLASKAYGDALFELAVEEHKVDEFMEEAVLIQTVLKENPDLGAVMAHPEIIKEERIRLIENCFKGRISDEMVGFLAVVIKKDRYTELPGIFAHFAARVREYKKIGVAEVVSASELTDTWKKQMEAKLLATTGYQKMEITYRVDKSLIGGLILRIGDRVVDNSLKSRLAAMKSQLLKVSLEQEKVGE